MQSLPKTKQHNPANATSRSEERLSDAEWQVVQQRCEKSHTATQDPKFPVECQSDEKNILEELAMTQSLPSLVVQNGISLLRSPTLLACRQTEVQRLRDLVTFQPTHRLCECVDLSCTSLHRPAQWQASSHKHGAEREEREHGALQPRLSLKSLQICSPLKCEQVGCSPRLLRASRKRRDSSSIFTAPFRIDLHQS